MIKARTNLKRVPMPKVREFRFEVIAEKEIIVDGFSDVSMARRWLIERLEEECDDIINSSTYVSDGVEK